MEILWKMIFSSHTGTILLHPLHRVVFGVANVRVFPSGGMT